ncbi:MAG: hypothetical protein IMZ73_02660 [Chloroflexi bacterium]|nr:hypothetical protein [Chloroflexota bacterium]
MNSMKDGLRSMKFSPPGIDPASLPDPDRMNITGRVRPVLLGRRPDHIPSSAEWTSGIVA